MKLCKNCKFTQGKGWICCKVPTGETYRHFFDNSKLKIYLTLESSEENANFNCKYYQRKWYKIWVNDK